MLEIYLVLKSITPEQLQDFQSDSNHLDAFARVPVRPFGPDADFGLSLGKAGQALHYMFTGTALGGDWPWNFLLTGGTPIGNPQPKLPIRLLSVFKVREACRALESFLEGQIAERLNRLEMQDLEIFPPVWDKREQSDDELIDWLTKSFFELRDFLQRALEHKRPILVITD